LFVGDTAFIDNVGYYEIPFANKSQFIDTLKLITTFEGNTIVYPRHWTPGFTVQHLIDNNNILNNLIKSKN
jgi:glyoxylase-like metal-dependent hydrolase (beta-lactamase superfamily II)